MYLISGNLRVDVRGECAQSMRRAKGRCKSPQPGPRASGFITAVGDLELAPDELSSFAAGVLQAGAPCAVATLWTVRDIPTFLLMVRFMREMFQKHSPTPARALREASQWLRTATYEQ